MRHRTPFWRVLAVLALGMCAACQSTRFGGQEHTVVLETIPEGAQAYLIPYHKWLANSADIVGASNGQLAARGVTRFCVHAA